MNNNERFGSIESMLADLLRSVDRLAAKMDGLAGHVDNLTGNVEKLTVHAERQGEQINDIINILKISDARHTKAEIRQDEALDAIRAQGKRLDEQGKQLDEQGKRLEEQSRRADEQSRRADEQSRRSDALTEGLKQLLQAQAQTLGLLTYTSNRTDKLTAQDETYEARFQRLEEAVFRKAS